MYSLFVHFATYYVTLLSQLLNYLLLECVLVIFIFFLPDTEILHYEIRKSGTVRNTKAVREATYVGDAGADHVRGQRPKR